MNYADQYPTHCRTSCSDTALNNADPDGGGCRRCNALLFDRYFQVIADKRDRFAQGVIAALAVLTSHGHPHGSTMHDEVMITVGEKSIYAAAEDEDYEWAGLNKRKKPKGKKGATP